MGEFTMPERTVDKAASTDAPPRGLQERLVPTGPALSEEAGLASPTLTQPTDAGTTRRMPYYYRRILSQLSRVVEPGAKVLDIGCGTGELLAHLKPGVGVGVDTDGGSLAKARCLHPQLSFVEMRGESVDQLSVKFDYVIISQVLGEVYDIGELLTAVQGVCHDRTRVMIVQCSRVWQPALKLAEWLRIKRPSRENNWLPADELEHLLKMHGFDSIQTTGQTLAPLPMPLVSGIINRVVANLPIFRQLCLNYTTVARSLTAAQATANKTASLTIVVPARNEAGNIAPLLDRIPKITEQQEVIFVEGHSRDDSWEVIQRVVRNYDGPFRVRCMQQHGEGKGDAVRQAFAAATGDVLMILDADLSVPPEELPAFYHAITSGQGELINGSRMVYLMDRKAMRFLNLLANKLFGWLFTFLIDQRCRDTLCGTKVLTRQDYERIATNRKYFGALDPFGDFDLLLGAARLRLKIVDMPVHYKARTYGDTNISRFRHGFMLLRMCAVAGRKLKFI